MTSIRTEERTCGRARRPGGWLLVLGVLAAVTPGCAAAPARSTPPAAPASAAGPPEAPAAAAPAAAPPPAPPQEAARAPGANESSARADAPQAAPRASAPAGAAGAGARAGALQSASADLEASQRELDVAAGDCRNACRALGSMDRAAGRLCALAEGDGEARRCTEARQRVYSARDRVKTTCGECPGGPSVDRAAPIPSVR